MLGSYGDIAEAFSRALHEKITYVPQSPEEAIERMLRQGISGFMANVTIMIETNQKLGLAEKLHTDNVEKITEDIPITFDEFARDYYEYFK